MSGDAPQGYGGNVGYAGPSSSTAVIAAANVRGPGAVHARLPPVARTCGPSALPVAMPVPVPQDHMAPAASNGSDGALPESAACNDMEPSDIAELDTDDDELPQWAG